jgi:hypothetical protein
MTSKTESHDIDMEPPQSALSSIWESNLDDDEQLNLNRIHPVIVYDDDVDDDFLMIADDVDDNVSLGLMEHEDSCEPGGDLDIILFRADCPATPPPEDDPMSVHEITPDARKGVVKMDVENIRLPDLQELREQYGISCGRMTESIWHSEMTRRWRAHHAKIKSPSNILLDNPNAVAFLSGTRATLTHDLEDSRRRMWALMHSTEIAQITQL